MVLQLQMATLIVLLSVMMVREFLAIALLAILRNLIVTNNIARDVGGGMYSQNSLNQITNVDFVGNIANSGGELYNYIYIFSKKSINKI